MASKQSKVWALAPRTTLVVLVEADTGEAAREIAVESDYGRYSNLRSTKVWRVRGVEETTLPRLIRLGSGAVVTKYPYGRFGDSG
jgi:hypothetical protein